MILTRNPYHSTDSNSMFLSEFKMMLRNCSTSGSSGLTSLAGRPLEWSPHGTPFLEQKRCSDGFFVQKGLVGVICNGNTASETTLRAAPIVLRVRLTFDALDACDLIFSPPTSVGRSELRHFAPRRDMLAPLTRECTGVRDAACRLGRGDHPPGSKVMRAMPSGFFCRQKAWIRTGLIWCPKRFLGSSY